MQATEQRTVNRQVSHHHVAHKVESPRSRIPVGSSDVAVLRDNSHGEGRFSLRDAVRCSAHALQRVLAICLIGLLIPLAVIGQVLIAASVLMVGLCSVCVAVLMAAGLIEAFGALVSFLNIV